MKLVWSELFIEWDWAKYAGFWEGSNPVRAVKVALMCLKRRMDFLAGSHIWEVDGQVNSARGYRPHFRIIIGFSARSKIELPHSSFKTVNINCLIIGAELTLFFKHGRLEQQTVLKSPKVTYKLRAQKGWGSCNSLILWPVPRTLVIHCHEDCSISWHALPGLNLHDVIVKYACLPVQSRADSRDGHFLFGLSLCIYFFSKIFPCQPNMGIFSTEKSNWFSGPWLFWMRMREISNVKECLILVLKKRTSKFLDVCKWNLKLIIGLPIFHVPNLHNLYSTQFHKLWIAHIKYDFSASNSFALAPSDFGLTKKVIILTLYTNLMCLIENSFGLS